ncbi:hypothetical protein LLG95_08425 [bacterium]|nr:hypothetical protein [bacterium]
MIRRAVIIIGLIAWPVLGAWLGRAAAPELARINNVVAVARRADRGIDTIVQAQAREIQGRFAVGTTLFGAWCGLAVAMQIASALRRRAPKDYDVDAMTCVTCGRCWAACPVERRRVKNARQTQ